MMTKELQNNQMRFAITQCSEMRLWPGLRLQWGGGAYNAPGSLNILIGLTIT